MQPVNVVVTLPQNDFLDAEMSRTGRGRSEIVREALQFFIDYKVTPEIMARLIAERKETMEPAKPAAKTSKIAA